MTDESKRRAIVNEMQAILAQDVLVLPLYPTRMQISRKATFDIWYYTAGGIGSTKCSRIAWAFYFPDQSGHQPHDNGTPGKIK